MHILSFSWRVLRLFPSWAVCEQDSRERLCTGFYADTCSFLQSVYLGMKLLGPVPSFKGFYFEIIYSKLKKKSSQMSCVLFTQFPTMGTCYITVMQYRIQDVDFYKVHRTILMPPFWHALMCVHVCVVLCSLSLAYTCVIATITKTQNCCHYKMKPHAIHLRPHPSSPYP